jgi:hypothetical protein
MEDNNPYTVSAQGMKKEILEEDSLKKTLSAMAGIWISTSLVAR